MHRAASIALTLGMLSSPILAGSPDDLFDWITVGNPGNASAIGHDPGVGSVDYTYRLTRSPVTADRWFDFVQAYRPYHNGPSWDMNFLGDMVIEDPQNPTGPDGRPNYILPDSLRRRPTTPGLEYAARYINWLHNGMVNEQWAFESGVYDTSTFYLDENLVAQHDLTPAPGARYWIPSFSEMLKAAYYDPEKDGGQGGWWLFPNRSDEALVVGRPEDGGETIADLVDYFMWDVGQYPDTMSAYGLLDVSGTANQMTSTQFGANQQLVKIVGSAAGEDRLYGMLDDHLYYSFTQERWITNYAFMTFRIASTLPCPADLAPPSGTLNATDVTAYLDRFQSADPAADLAEPFGIINFFDLAAYLAAFNTGCE
jgi:hypothetical protein